jgi:catechol 2,3-dioxygenase-like lactoylglutathione lyase family enzyme
MNEIATSDNAHPLAYALSHFVLFTHDRDRAERFYAERLGFRTVDIFTNLGPFMRPAGTNDHHTLFLIQVDRLGMQHFTFHFAGAHEVLKAGWNMTAKGYTSNWGPGRHILGSNWFWYFDSPFGCLMELDADMDLHDDTWSPREMIADELTSQSLVLQYMPKHSPASEQRKALTVAVT